MPFLVRKITRAKWKGCDEKLDAPIFADAITRCLSTSSNTLSVWYAADESEINNAKIALFASLQRVETIDITVLDEGELIKNGLTLVQTPGVTGALQFVGLHRDISGLTVDELKKVAVIVQESIINKKCVRVNERGMKDILNAAITANVVNKKDLSEGLAKSLQ